MSQKNSVTIKLESPEEPGANLYNAYHLLTQLAGFYAQAAAFEPSPVAASTWRELTDAALTDLGALYQAWDMITAEARAGRPLQLDQVLAQRIARTCTRMHRLASALSVWTPMARWARVLCATERRLAGYLVAFAAASPVLGRKAGQLQHGNGMRVSRLTGLMERYLREEQQTSGMRVIKVDPMEPVKKAG